MSPIESAERQYWTFRSQPGLCTAGDVKSRAEIADTSEYDLMLNRIIQGVTEIFENWCQRGLLDTGGDETEYHTGGCPYLQLRRYPVRSITSIKESLDWDWANETALTADSDYRLQHSGQASNRGILYRVGGKWLEHPDGVQAVYRGGYTPAGQVVSTSSFALPDDLRELAIEQSFFLFKRRDDIGLSGAGTMGGSFSKFQDLELLPQVKQGLDPYKRRFL